MTIQQAKEIDMVDYLLTLGHRPEKISGTNYWYLSPLHDEKNASFKVNRHMNRWYDFALGRGGNLVDFGIMYHQCSINDFLQKFDGFQPNIDPVKIYPKTGDSSASESKTVEIIDVKNLKAFPLINYLLERRIKIDVAQQFCKEVNYKIGGKEYYAIGFKNEAGGYELRNRNFKGSSSPKDFTLVNNSATNLAVFEGFFDFLSFVSLFHNGSEKMNSILVLNSTSFFEKALPKMEEHQQVHLYLDNDKTGDKFSQLAIGKDKEKFIDQRTLYRPYKDLNEWLIQIRQIPRQEMKQRNHK